MDNPIDYEVSRHDDHNLELKFTLESRPEGLYGRTDIFLFLPAAMKLGSYSKPELRLDFHSRLRLRLPGEGSESTSLSGVAESLDAFLARHAAVRAGLLVETANVEGVVSSIQRIGAFAGEALKARQAAHRQQLLLAHALAGGPEDPAMALQSLSRDIEETAVTIRRMMQSLRAPEAAEIPLLPLLTEYVAHLYVRYLADLQSALEELLEKRHRFLSAKFERGWATIEPLLKQLTAEAARCGYQRPLDLASDRELQLVRLGQLKKFFHANLFVEVAKREVRRKFQEPVAAVAAACAAVWATYMQRYQQPGLQVGVSGSLLFIAVAAYVMKDRMKEMAKNFLARKASQFLPDLEQALFARDRAIGKIREWFDTVSPAKIPPAILAFRRAHSLSDAEPHLQEEVLHYAKHYAVKGEPSGSTARWAIQESLRVTIERYLKHMDDPYKDFTLLEADGNLAKVKTHRVYPFLMVVRTERLHPRTPAGFWAVAQQSSPVKLEAFRVVIDKSGIQRVEPVGDALESTLAETTAPIPALDPLPT